MNPSGKHGPGIRSAVETAEMVRRREVSAAEITEAALERIALLNDDVNAFAHLAPELARRDAAAVDRLVAAGEDPGPLAGVPLGVKDNLACAGMPTGHGSLVFKGGPCEPEDAILMARLRAAGAIAVGKTAIPEFATDSATHSPGWGVTRNPWDTRRTPGGSSGGSAAAVAAGIVPLATGSDWGGSIRSPAAFTGLVGLMPTHGRIPLVPPTDLDVLGGLAFTVADAARYLDVAAGPDPRDRHSLPAPASSFEAAAESLDTAGLRACWSEDLGFATVSREVADVAERAAGGLCDVAGLELIERQFAPPNPYTTLIDVESFELSARLRASGVYPDRASDLAELTRQVVEVWAPDELGWMRARQQREEIVAQTMRLFSDVDVLFTPTVACTAFAAEESIPAEIEGRDASESGAEPFTMLANMCWLPAISIPVGLSSDGLPIGLQAIAPRMHEGLLLRLARIVEQTWPWPRCRATR